MSNRFSFACLLLALSGCDTMTVIGDRADTGGMVDAGVERDAFAAGDAPLLEGDAPRPPSDAFSPTDAFVLPGTGRFVSIAVATTHPSISATPMDRLDIFVRVQATEEGSPTPRLIERSGACQVDGVGVTPALPAALAVTSVTAQIGGGAATPLTFSAMQGYSLNVAPPSAGTPIVVRVDMGTRVIERTLTVRDLRMTTPMPIPASIQWRATYAAGLDVPFAWPAGARAGDLTLVGAWDPLGLNPSPERRNMTCTLDTSASAFSVPWGLFNAHLVDAAASAPLVWLVNAQVERAMEGDVTVRASSSALSEFVTLSPR